MRSITLLVAVAAGPAFAEGFDGIYRPAGSSWDCVSIGSDGGALAVRDGIFYGLESACELTNPTRVNGMDAVLYDAQCNGEGESYGYRLMLMRLGDGLAVIEDGAVSELERCN